MKKTSMKLLFVQPHQDDVAYSISITLGELSTNYFDCTVMTVFQESIHVPEVCDESLSVEVSTAIRCIEDLMFKRNFVGKFKMVGIGLGDAKARGIVNDFDSIFLKDIPFDELDVEIIKDRVLQRVDSYDIVFLPLGLGDHLDHRIITQALLESKSSFVFYEDLPYAYSLSEEEIKERVSEVENATSSELERYVVAPSRSIGMSRAVQLKKRWIDCYSSQGDWSKEILGSLEKNGGEVVWGTKDSILKLENMRN